MCKILGFSNTAKITVSIETFVNTSLNAVKRQERDGLGYELTGDNGRYGERMTGDGLQYGLGNHPYAAIPFLQVETGEAWGTEPTKLVGPAIFHSRTSTNHVSLENTHPLRRDGISVIHNGVVSNIGAKYKQETTNDTEHILHYLATKDVDVMAASLTGYYAVLYLDRDDNLGVIRDRTADLRAAWAESLESWIFATNDAIIQEVWKALKIAGTPLITDVIPDLAFVLNARNEILELKEIKSLGYGKSEATKAKFSLGRSLDTGILDMTTRLDSVGNVAPEHEGPSKAEREFIKFVEDIARGKYGTDYALFLPDESEVPYDMVQTLEDKDVLNIVVIDEESDEEITVDSFVPAWEREEWTANYGY